MEMEYNSKTKNMEVSVKMTGHDLDKEMEDVYKVNFHSEKQSEENHKLLENYLKETVKLSQGNKELNLVLDGFESDLSGDLFVFFHFEKFGKSKSFRLINNLLLLTFPEQQNITSIKIEEEKHQKTLTIKDNTFVVDK